jgi:hypothetical protein
MEALYGAIAGGFVAYVLPKLVAALIDRARNRAETRARHAEAGSEEAKAELTRGRAWKDLLTEFEELHEAKITHLREVHRAEVEALRARAEDCEDDLSGCSELIQDLERRVAELLERPEHLTTRPYGDHLLEATERGEETDED